MDKVRVYYDAFGKTLTVWLGDPNTEVSCDEADDDTVFMKDADGHIIGFEKLNVTLDSSSAGLTVELINALELEKAQGKAGQIAGRLIHADLIILDEPTIGLDPHQIRSVRALIKELGRTTTILLSTHLIHDIEKVLDHVVFLQAGRVVLSAPVETIRDEQGKSVDTLFREVFRC